MKNVHILCSYELLSQLMCCINVTQVLLEEELKEQEYSMICKCVFAIVV